MTIKNKQINLLDHGFLRVVDVMGDDEAIVQAARVSYGKGTKSVCPEDAALIDYLIRHKHTSPLEMCEIKLHVKMPMFVARQWIRHRTANVNEVSARYSVMTDEFYIPKKENLAPQSKTNKQGRAAEELSDREAEEILTMLKEDSNRAYEHYLEMLNEDRQGNQMIPDRVGLSRELARMNLPVNLYTEWYWKIDLHNLLHFLRLRAHSHAQYEIRVYAEALLEVVKEWVPHTYKSFRNHVLDAVTFSGDEMEALCKAIDPNLVEFTHPSVGRRREFANKLDL